MDDTALPAAPLTFPTAKLPEAVSRRGFSEAQWNTLRNLWPGARDESILLAADYCKARGLDVLKRPCHIVPMEVRVGDRYEWRDQILPGIYELRTTAHRTGLYLGHDKPEYGPEQKLAGVLAPTWCAFTVYRRGPAGDRCAFPVVIWFAECVATKRDGTANARWSKAPRQMLTKVAEAAALREAFPEEVGGIHAEEELDGQRAIDVTPVTPAPETALPPPPPKPDGFDEWLGDLVSVAEEGMEKLRAAWKASPKARQAYLVETDQAGWDAIKARAEAADATRALATELS